MKRIFAYAAGLFISFSAAAAPGSQLIQKFKQTFPNAENVKWNDAKDGYYVSFYQHGNFEKVFYNSDGDFVSSWRYSDGKDLPTNIMMKLKNKYGESTIKGVTELTKQDGVIYEIQLSQGAKWYSIQTTPDGNIVSEKKYKTQG